MCGQCDATPTVTLAAYTGTKLILLGDTDMGMCFIIVYTVV